MTFRAVARRVTIGSIGAIAIVSFLACGSDFATIGRQVDETNPSDSQVGSSPAACTSSCKGSATSCGVDYCSAIPELPTEPIIDGVLDCDLPLAMVPSGNWNNNGVPKPADLSVEYAVAWRPAGKVYYFVHVHTSQRKPAAMDAGGDLFCGDACHLMLDNDGQYVSPPFYDDPGTRQFILEAPPDDVTPVSIGLPNPRGPTTWSADTYRAFPVPDGYVVEAVLGANELGLAAWPLAEGGHIGFSLSIGVGGTPGMYPSTPSCEKVGDHYLNGVARTARASGLPHDTVGAFCNPRLAQPL
ncbi:hypothetical protein AKJ09_02749 [Labilithrix luteola]|uniref:Carbohydrate-binding domain-containing protein n=1 Tax=Labilithrix luteola TaxID=1391654 RepID=A0A0K1PRB6_9BACT|nr:hypothetical protein [Labilithrix luteola]AKU96085.1 hypothetical protein AKJ09_02749 [Labilithrix luteola]